MNIKELAHDIHQNNIDKGFWQVANVPEKLMLIITELSEAVESHRKNKRASIPVFELNMNSITNPGFEEVFKNHIKDSLEDEFADAFIRILDLGYYLDIDEFYSIFTNPSYYDLEENFAENILKITSIITRAYDDFVSECEDSVKVRLARAAKLIYDLCRHMNIDLGWHVEKKMKYNASRPYMHNKAY